MSEIVKNENNEDGGSEWENMAESVDIEKRLEDGENPEKILAEAYEEGYLTPDFVEEYGSTLMQYGLNEDKLESYDQLSRKGDREDDKMSPEDWRHRHDEEPEQEGYESDVA